MICTFAPSLQGKPASNLVYIGPYKGEARQVRQSENEPIGDDNCVSILRS